MKSIVVVVVASLVAASCGQAPPAAEPPAATAPAKTPSGPTAKYAAKVPASVTTPDTVQTRIGTLKFSDGLPDADTVKKVYDNLDFVRGVEAFLLGMPAANVQGHATGLHRRRLPAQPGLRHLRGLGGRPLAVPDPEHGRGLYLGDHRRQGRADGAAGAARRAGHPRRRPLPLRHRPRGFRGPTRARAANTWWCRRATPARFRRRARAIS